MSKAPKVVMYATPTCPYCHAARDLLQEKGVTYEEINVAGNPALRQEMAARSGRRTVPQIFINDRHIGGYDDLDALERSGQLDPLLGPR
ncbi:MAG: glutaredoxin 3 [Gammaproteobacteria bacterium]|nr:glutaredoxin 3 [Gammaproteobacteria bacterium]